MSGKVLEQQPLRSAERDQLATLGQQPALKINLDVAEGDDAGTGRHAAGSTQYGANARSKLVRVERLCDVVVCTKVQALGFVAGRAFGRQQDDRDRTPFSKLAHDLDAVE